ncbi:MAG: Ig-like domain-containing protein [Thermoplasmata archaeon]
MTASTAEAPPDNGDSPYLVVETDKSEYYLGETVLVNVTLVNPTGNHYDYGFPDSCFWDIFFYNDTGDLAYKPGFICLTMIMNVHLNPFEERSLGHFVWNQTEPREEKIGDKWFVIYDPLYSTSYRIEVKLRRFGLGYGLSNETTVQIVGPPPPPPLPSIGLRGSIATPSHVLSGSLTTVTVSVRDGEEGPVEGVNVTLNATLGHLNPRVGSTDVNGRFSTTFEAPTVQDNSTARLLVVIQGLEKQGYVADFLDYSIIHVLPPGSKFLHMTLIPLTGDITLEETSISYVIEVTDENRMPVTNATFDVTAEPETLLFEILPVAGDGRYRLDFVVPAVQNDTQFQIQVNARKNGHVSDLREFDMFVLDRAVSDEDKTPDNTLFTSVALIAIFAFSILGGYVMASMRKRRKTK